MKRSEQNPAYQWDLRAIYPDTTAWEAAMQAAAEAIDALASVPGTLGTSKKSLKAGLDAVTDAAQKTKIPYIYAFLKKTEDGSVPLNQEMEARANSLSVRFAAATSFLSPEILAIPAETLTGWMADDTLATYRHTVDDIVRTRAHTLSAEREQMLALLGDAASMPKSAYEMLTDVDLRFPKVKNDAGEEVALTSGTFPIYRESRSRAVREGAFRAMFGTYRQFGDTIATLYGGSVKFDTYFANQRGYRSACEAALDGGNVPVSVYDSLIAAVHESLPSMRKYLELRKRALKLDQIDVFDLYTPIVEDIDYPMSFEDAKALVREAVKPLGADYCAIIDRALNERWIDVYESDGKQGGAFSCGVYGVHPYVLLNFAGTLNDAFTLAHELGHAMHSWYSDSANDFVNHDYRIMVAEVASTVNEVLLTKYLLKTETDPKRRAYILNHFLESFRTTIYRQTLFAEFERKVHELYAAGQPLTAAALDGVYHELEALYYDGIGIDKDIDPEWSFIPHFYRAFYVYQYATGFSSAVAIAEHILTTGDASGYRKFLTTGGSDYPLEELKLAGVDLTKPDTVASALRVFDETVDELSALLN